MGNNQRKKLAAEAHNKALEEKRKAPKSKRNSKTNPLLTSVIIGLSMMGENRF